MKIFNFKKADGGLTAIIIVIIVLVFIVGLIFVGDLECRSNKDCNDEQYCGSDFICHNIPVIEKSPVVYERHYTVPALIIGISLIITAIILKWDRIKPRRNRDEEFKSNVNDAPRNGLMPP